MMTKGKTVETSNKQVQTTIHCFPHILTADSEPAKVFCNRSCQTAASTAPDTTNLKFYAFLQFTPYTVIAEESIKEIDLPRRALLHWNLSNPVLHSKEEISFSAFTKSPERQESELLHQKGVLKKANSDLTGASSFTPLLTPHHYTMQKSVVEEAVQTTLTVSPHVLETDEVANVFAELSIQTSITCLPNDSISNILPQLQANLSHFSGSATSVGKTSAVVSQGSRVPETRAEHALDQVEEEIRETDEFIDEPMQIAEKDAESTKFGLLDPEKRRLEDKNHGSCSCGRETLSRIAGQLRVQASTLRLTSTVFPPGARFEDRMMAVLNTTIAVLQTEMANIIELYTDETNNICACTTSSVYTCERHETESQNYHKPCLCDTPSCRPTNYSKIAPEEQNEIKKEAIDYTPENEIVIHSVSLDAEDTQPTTSTGERANEVLEETPQKQYPPSITDEDIEEPVQDSVPTQILLEIIGDLPGSKLFDNIDCECRPSEVGAAPPIVSLQFTPPQPATSEGSDLCICPENRESVTDVANATSVTNEELSMVTDDAPSLVEDSSAPEKAIKFEILLKRNVKDVESASATSAIVVRATLSCPNTSKSFRKNGQTGSSLPDLRDQVIRLSVIYKKGSEIQMEETLTPGRPITISSYKSPTSRVQPVNYPHSPSFHDDDTCTCSRLVDASKPSGHNIKVDKSISTSNKINATTSVKIDATTSSVSYSIRNINLQSQPEHDVAVSKTSNKPKSVSSMACPVHRKPPCGLCAPRNPGITSGLRGFPRTDDYQINVFLNVDDEAMSHSFMYEHDASYDEPYMDELVEFREVSTGVQTDLMLGDKLESESLVSMEFTQEDQLQNCDSKTEMPWQKISLPAPGTYTIKPVESKRSPEDTSQISKSSRTSKPLQEEQASKLGPEEEEEEQGAISLSSTTDDQPSGDPGPTRKRKEPLLFESERYKHNEPYMEGLYRAFPNSDEDDNCGSDTEMPWKDILLPKNCKIQKVMKGKKCTCKSAREKLSGMFISPSKSSRKIEDEEEGIIQIHIGFNEPPSGVILVQEGAATQQKISVFSDITEQPKRVPKQHKLQMYLGKYSNASVSFQGGKTSVRNIPTGSTVSSKSSRTISLSARIPGKNSLNIVNIKPSVECAYPSERIFVSTGKPSAEIRVIEPSMYLGNVPSHTQSCSTMKSTKMSCQPSVKSIMKNTSSMPAIPSKSSVRTTVSVKQAGKPHKVVSQTIDSRKKGSIMTTKVPSVQLKISNVCTPAAKRISSTTASAGSSAPRCPCVTKGNAGTSKRDPVMAAIEAYEAEMKPLMKAVTELQQKIKNLNITEMSDCGCTSAAPSKQPGVMYPSPIVHSKVHITGEPGKVTRTTTRVRPPINIPGQYSQMTCPFVQPIGFGSSPSPIFGKLGIPVLSSTYQPYLPSTSKYSPSTTPDHQASCSCQRGAKSVKEPRPNNDFSAQAKIYGKPSNCYSRKHQEEKRRGCCTSEKYKTQNGITGYSSGTVTSDYSDLEDKCPLAVSQHKSSKDRHRHHDSKYKTSSSKTDRSNKNDECPPCKDYFETYLRPDQAVKTSPEEFLSSTNHCKRKPTSGGVKETPSSKSKFEFKFPYR